MTRNTNALAGGIFLLYDASAGAYALRMARHPSLHPSAFTTNRRNP
jgi:hypothetical protein